MSQAQLSTFVDYPEWHYKTPTAAGKDAFGAWMNEKTIAAGEEYHINPTIHAVRMGLRWKKGVDIDASAALFDAQGNLCDAVCFRKLGSGCGSVTHSGDSVTGEGEGDQEAICVELGDVPLNVHHIVFVATIFEAEVSFEKVESARVTMMSGKEDSKGNELFTFKLSGLSENAVLVGHLTRKGAYWSFKALGESLKASDVREVLKGERLKECLRAYPSDAPEGSHISVTVLKGRNLAAKDVQLIFWREATSDPYYTIRFGNRTFKSRHKEQTLNPNWEEHRFDMGSITKAETRPLEIDVFDYDRFSEDDFMGTIQIIANEIFELGHGEHVFWFPLQKSKEIQYEKEEVDGEILVRFNVEALQ